APQWLTPPRPEPPPYVPAESGPSQPLTAPPATPLPLSPDSLLPVPVPVPTGRRRRPGRTGRPRLVAAFVILGFVVILCVVLLTLLLLRNPLKRKTESRLHREQQEVAQVQKRPDALLNSRAGSRV